MNQSEKLLNTMKKTKAEKALSGVKKKMKVIKYLLQDKVIFIYSTTEKNEEGLVQINITVSEKPKLKTVQWIKEA